MTAAPEKRALRDEMRARRATVTVEESRAAGARLAALLERRPERRIVEPRTAMVYAWLRGEIDSAAVDALLRSRGAAVCYPRTGEPGTLTLHLAARDELSPGRHGIREPAADAPQVAPEALDFALVPGLAFDRRGNRLGFGKGYFDQLLARAPRAFRCGVCFPWQLLDRVPSEPHDERVHLVITDEIVEVTP